MKKSIGLEGGPARRSSKGWFALLALLVGLASACAEVDTASPILCQGDSQCPSGQVCRNGQCAQPVGDGGVSPTTDAGAGADAGLDGGADGDGGGGTDGGGGGRGFGETCAENGDCASQVCLESQSRSFCTRLCSDDCPSDFVCKLFVFDRDRLVNLCVPFTDVYCVQCGESSECLRPDDRCTSLSGANYCTRDCSATNACPAGFVCQDVPFVQTAEGQMMSMDGGDPDGGEGPVFRQCVPQSGKCPGCVDRDGDNYGAGSDCLGPDCNDLDNSVHPGATEVCDGRDNNCNDQIDEGFDLSSDNQNCGQCGVVCDQAAGQRCCGAACVNINTSINHCGACGRACTEAGEQCCSGDCRSTTDDPDHCGGCGQPCTNEHGGIACGESQCRPSCSAGFADCDQNPRNGCETPVTTIDNCGVCGQRCVNPHGATSCTGGECSPTCDNTWGNCDGNPVNGCETDLLTSTAHCGRCDTACINDHGTTACQNSMCRPQCETNWGDCDQNPNNGCETDLATSVGACGACNTPCTNDHGMTACQGGACVPTCDPNYLDCDANPRNGCETDSRSSILHCGGCNRPCTNQNGTTTCASSICVPSCGSGFGDCDGNPNNGCETNLTATVEHCGACGQPCANPHGPTSCAANLCVPTCDLGWGDCDGNARNGCETDIQATTAHCGGCGMGCLNPNGTTKCESGQCKPTCSPGFYDCNGNPRDGCEARLADVTTCNACQIDPECPNGFYCHQNVCTKKKPLGDACIVGTSPQAPGRECQSDFCIDGVCCENDCVGVCRSCRLTGTRGLCTFVQGGTDPDTECAQEAASTCGTDGTCDGAGACRLWGQGTECLAQSCDTGVQTNQRLCDGFGNCQPAVPPTTNCAPYVCNASSTCFGTCSTDAECAAGYSCVGGECKVSGGQPCNGPADCATGFCVDGVCCNELCSGLCERCDLGTAVGTCAAVPAGADPDNECAKDPVSSCGLTGACSGTRGACERFPTGTVCQPQSCAAGVQSNTRMCDGNGTCELPTPASVNCFPYVCNGTTQGCFSSCATDAECVSDYGCTGGQCKKNDGQGCGADAECKSGFCTDGVCCAARCDGACEKCNRTGRLGFCDAVPAGQDPDDECTAEDASTCGRTGQCSGNRSCALHPLGTICQAAFCAGNTSNAADTCDGVGVCVDRGSQVCAPLTCNTASGLCRTACDDNTQCVPGFECAGGVCKKSPGQTCGGGPECASGFCVDGVCCQGACSGVCERCNLSGRQGFCDPIPSGQDPDEECPVDPVSSCGRTGVCSGERSCQLFSSGTVCVASSCASVSTANRPDTCNGSGTCIDQGVADCAPFVCNATTGLCRNTCTTSADCVAGYGCRTSTGACLKNDGESCTGNGDCLSGACCDGICRSLMTDVTNCGICGRVCTNANGNTTCESGQCTPSCSPTFASCDSDPVNGCETNLTNSVDHCGACQHQCTNANGTRVCENSLCKPTCADGFGDCDGNADNGCETSILTSTNNCGACATQCTNLHGTTQCTSGQCNPSCGAGFGDCDGNPRNGCETDTTATTAHCGGCNQPCVNPHGTTSCMSSACAPTCDPGWRSCDSDPRNGCETDILGSVMHCGGCGQTCSNANGTTSCVGGFCKPVCAPGFYDCNGVPEDGCEADLSVVGTCNACTVDSDCPGGFYCNSSLCTRKKPLGDPCTVGTAPAAAGRECQTANCIDGVCCENDCTGQCRSCRLTGSRGFCSFIAAGQDPDVECTQAATSTCAADGTCDGAGGCRLWAAGTECLAQSCAAGLQTNARDCDGLGTCLGANPATTLCAPYTCNGSTGCFTSCANDSQCATGFSCVAGVCKVSGGQPCNVPGDCASLNCTDGVCCDLPCDGLCERCDLPGNIGSCTAIPGGTDPDNECTAQSPTTCGLTGSCSGSRGSCEQYPLGTICQAQSCTTGTQSNPRTCDGSGVCVTPDPATVACAPFVCNGTTQACFASCATDAECISGYGCVGGECKKVDGQSCGSDIECKSGFCTDGVCCGARCDGTCEKCSLTGRLGFCDPIANGQDPDEECSPEAASTCGRTGVCSGNRSCALHPPSTVCVAASCTGNTSNLARNCDGNGNCSTGSTADCSPFTCDATSGLCRNSCAVATDCISGYECAGGICKKSKGQPCGADGECASGFCTDGVCCEARCNGVCEKCDQVGRAGFCDAVPAGQDPDTECDQDLVATCQRTGSCSGNRSCALYSSGTVCSPATCTGNVSNLADTCNGSGTCVEAGTQNCLPYICNTENGLCKSSCQDESDCQSGYECISGECKKSQGGGCNTNADCATNFCADGVCCDGACDGTCESCDQAGREGFCDPIAVGTDPDNECATEAVATCQQNGFCSGSRSCALYPAGTVCTAASCTGNISNLADTCNGSGVCVDSGTNACAPYICNSANGLCKTSCGSDLDCQSGYQCASGICKKVRGSTCMVDSECASGFCTDNVCCDARCLGVCEKCNQSGRLGFCDPVPFGTDPDSECATDPVSTCGKVGDCSGARSCRLYASGTVCAAASCASTTTANNADTCDGTGSCVDNGQQGCSPYICSGSACLTSCSSDIHCASGYKCKTSTGQCLKDDGQSCSQNSQCFNNACCSGFCRNLSNDESHCGGCGTVCQAVNGTNTCLSGLCSPVCNSGFGNCDSNRNNGCETSLRTTSNCGSCGTVCNLPNASESCSTGTCTLTSCNSGYSNCDGSTTNGCEVQHSAQANACGSAINVGSKCGDASCGFFCDTSTYQTFATRTGRTSIWYRARANECSDCCTDVFARITLTPPSGTDYDLRVYSACGTLIGSSLNGGSTVDQVTVSKSDDCLGSDTGFDYWVEVRFFSGASCSSWTLVFQGTNC